eukprot:TRINITY_DN6834_c0_g1_i1.p1 TRINITY_DN6834_c0_g1~~TRINITY_DN6834_c0_g1_i1.p1  ORF type:complete len:1435 (-),score=545.22 TRINITY_DN6834_c0_g1_i1:180-4484(-)
MNQENFYTICVLGDSYVGKTNIISNYIDNTDKETYQPTRNPEQFNQENIFFGIKCLLKIIDTPGNHDDQKENFKKIFPNVDGFIMVFDYENVQSFNNLTKLYGEILKKYKKVSKMSKVPTIIFGNKKDQLKRVSKSSAEELSKQWGTMLIDTCGKSGDGIRDGMALLIRSINIWRKTNSGNSKSFSKSSLLNFFKTKNTSPQTLERNTSDNATTQKEPTKQRSFTLRGNKKNVDEEILEHQIELQKHLQNIDEKNGGNSEKDRFQSRDLRRSFSQKTNKLSTEELSKMMNNSNKQEALSQRSKNMNEDIESWRKKTGQMNTVKKNFYLTSTLGTKLLELENMIHDEESTDFSDEYTPSEKDKKKIHFCIDCNNIIDLNDHFCAECGTVISKGKAVTHEINDLDKLLEEIEINNKKEDHFNKLKKMESFESNIHLLDTEKKMWENIEYLESLFEPTQEEIESCQKIMKESSSELLISSNELILLLIKSLANKSLESEWNDLGSELQAQIKDEIVKKIVEDSSSIVPFGLHFYRSRDVSLVDFDIKLNSENKNTSIVSQFLQECSKQLKAYTLQTVFLSNSLLSEKKNEEEIINVTSSLLDVYKNILNTCIHLENLNSTSIHISHFTLIYLEKHHFAEELDTNIVDDYQYYFCYTFLPGQTNPYQKQIKDYLLKCIVSSSNMIRIFAIHTLMCVSYLTDKNESDPETNKGLSPYDCSVIQLSSISKSLLYSLKQLIVYVSTLNFIQTLQAPTPVDNNNGEESPKREGQINIWEAFFKRKKKSKSFLEEDLSSSSSSKKFSPLKGKRHKNKEQIERSSGGISKYDDKDNLMFGTINEIIESVTNTERINLKMMRSFMFTYRSFITPKRLLRKLEERYNVPPLIPEKIKTAIKVRVVTLINHWITHHFYDFDEALINNLKKFLKTASSEQKDVASLLSLKIEEMLNEREDKKKLLPRIPNTDLSLSTGGLLIHDLFLQLSSKEIARQMTLIDFQIFSEIQKSEFFSPFRKRKHFSPNISKLNQRMGKLINWVASIILCSESEQQCVDIIFKFMHIAIYLRQLNNFHTLMSIIHAFQLPSVARLKNIWSIISRYKEVLPRGSNTQNSRESHSHTISPFSRKDSQNNTQDTDNQDNSDILNNNLTNNTNHPSSNFVIFSKIHTQFQKLQVLMNPSSNFSNYSPILPNLTLPALPYLHFFLNQISFIEDEVPNYMESKRKEEDKDKEIPEDEKVINFKKQLDLFETINQISTFQSENYNLLPTEPVYTLLQELPSGFDNDDLFALSLIKEKSANSHLLGRGTSTPPTTNLREHTSNDQDDFSDDNELLLEQQRLDEEETQEYFENIDEDDRISSINEKLEQINKELNEIGDDEDLEQIDENFDNEQELKDRIEKELEDQINGILERSPIDELEDQILKNQIEEIIDEVEMAEEELVEIEDD